MNYYAVDRWSSGDSLVHYKYLKKIKIGPYTRYFYSEADIKNYYNALNKNSREIASSERYAKSMSRGNNFIWDTINPLRWGKHNADAKAYKAAVKETSKFEKSIKKKNKQRAKDFKRKNLFGFKSASEAKAAYKKSINKHADNDEWHSYSRSEKYNDAAKGNWKGDVNGYLGIKRKYW